MLPIPTMEVHGASGVSGEIIRRQRFRSFRNDLHGAFHCAAMHVAPLILLERKVANDHGYAIDFIANMKQTCAGGSCCQPSKNPHRLPLDVPKDVRRQSCAGRITNLDGAAKRLLNGLICIHERQKPKVAVSNRVDEDIHVGI
jgi:hypothetical protein